jgi:hypothetical protein
MPVSFFQKLTIIFLLALSIDGNFDFLVVAARGSRLLPARRDFLCYRSLCYHCGEGCLCWRNFDTGEPLQQTVYKACGYYSQNEYLTFGTSVLSQCLLPKVAPAQLFSEINKWPNAHEDVFAPSIFHPPESY